MQPSITDGKDGDPRGGPRLGRRAVLLGAAGLGLAACTGDPGGSAASTAAGTGSTTPSSTSATTSTSSTAPTSSASSTTATPTVAPLPASAVWPISPNEPEPVAKERAVRLIESLTAWTSGQSDSTAAAARLVAIGIPADRAGALAEAAAPFLSGQEATARVISAQYGGLTTDQAAILVTYEQWTRPVAGGVLRGGSAADVRLARRSGEWAVTELHPADPGPPSAGPPALVQALLTHPRIHLPPSAAADIAALNLMPKPMQALLDLADRYEIDVSIVHSAHPANVFATNRLSDHTRKRAFDVWAVNGQPVIASSTPDALVDGFLRDTRDVGAYNVGGPRLLSGAGFFSDPTHRDHTHIGFNADT